MTDPTPATRRPSAAERRALDEQLEAARGRMPGWVLDAVDARRDAPRATLARDVLAAAAHAMRDYATAWDGSGRKGGKGTAVELRQAAARIMGLVQDLDAMIADMPAPEPAETPEVTEPAEVTEVTEPPEVVTSAEIAQYLRGERDDLPPPAELAAALATEPSAERGDAPVQPEPPDALPPLQQPDPGDPTRAPIGPRLTWAQVSQAPDPSTAPDHRSWSQVKSFSDCGMRYRLERRTPGVTARPGWAAVGGTALHSAVEWIERGLWVNPELALDADELWREAFAQSIARTAADSGVAPDRWHVANRGAEGWTWWNAEGPEMVRRYLAGRPGFVGGESSAVRRHLLVMVPGDTVEDTEPVVEEEFTFDVVTGHDLSDPEAPRVPVRGVIDQAWECRPDGDPGRAWIEIVDIKSGRSVPDRRQLLLYALWLSRQLGRRDSGAGRPHLSRAAIRGRWWDARKGMYGQAETIIEGGSVFNDPEPYRELSYLVGTMDSAERAGLYLPRPSPFCSACAVSHACPAR